MYQYTGPRQTTGATANFSVGDFPTATYVPVPAVSANACLPSNSGLMSSFAQQAHNSLRPAVSQPLRNLRHQWLARMIHLMQFFFH